MSPTSNSMNAKDSASEYKHILPSVPYVPYIPPIPASNTANHPNSVINMIDEAQFQERVMDIYTDQLDEASRPVRDNLHVSFEEEATTIPEKKTIGCCRQGCKLGHEDVRKCYWKDCDRMIHQSCFFIIKNKYNLDSLPDDMVACTKLCYTKSIRGLEHEKKE